MKARLPDRKVKPFLKDLKAIIVEIGGPVKFEEFTGLSRQTADFWLRQKRKPCIDTFTHLQGLFAPKYFNFSFEEK